MKFTQTKNLLEVNYNDGGQVVYYTFKAHTNQANYYHVLEKQNYYLVGCYGGDEIRYYKDGKTVEYINVITNKITILTDRTFRIYEDEDYKEEQ